MGCITNRRFTMGFTTSIIGANLNHWHGICCSFSAHRTLRSLWWPFPARKSLQLTHEKHRQQSYLSKPHPKQHQAITHGNFGNYYGIMVIIHFSSASFTISLWWFKTLPWEPHERWPFEQRVIRVMGRRLWVWLTMGSSPAGLLIRNQFCSTAIYIYICI